MLALLCVILALFVVGRAWVQSGMTWFEFVILRGSFFYSRMMHRWSLRGRLPARGPAIVIINHSCSADPTFILAACDRLPCFYVSREHFRLHPITHFVLKTMDCVPVTRNGQDPTALRQGLRRLSQGRVVCMFPEGNLSGVAGNRQRPGKPGMAYLALRSRAPVIPVRIQGGPRTDQLLRSWLVPSAKSVRIHFGKPVDLSAYYGRPRTRQLIEEVSRLLMRAIREAGLPKKSNHGSPDGTDNEGSDK